MIKDQRIKRLLIPLTGLSFPLLTGLVSVRSDSMVLILSGICFFTAVVYLIWNVVVRLTSLLRNLAQLKKAIVMKLVATLLAGAFSAGAIAFVATSSWWRWNGLPFLWPQVWRVSSVAAVGGTFLSLVYEVVFLQVEKQLDTLVLQQLDRDRQEAELNVLKNELDPHFFFNCMNTLSHLVKEEPEKAYQFVHKLSNIYKYFLRNRQVDYVPLQDELEFLENYFYLLRIRFDNTIRMEIGIDTEARDVSILPCTLQTLVENAMKHNCFSEKEPLVISIGINHQFITVSNPVRPKPYAADSTKVGLQNLKARYRLLTNQNIVVQKTSSRFLVKLPITKQINHYDKSSDH